MPPLVERLGEPVLVVEGALLAAKVTTPADLAWANMQVGESAGH